MGKFENGGSSAEGRKIPPRHLQSLICFYQEGPLGVAAENISNSLALDCENAIQRLFFHRRYEKIKFLDFFTSKFCEEKKQMLQCKLTDA